MANLVLTDEQRHRRDARRSRISMKGGVLLPEEVQRLHEQRASQRGRGGMQRGHSHRGQRRSRSQADSSTLRLPMAASPEDSVSGSWQSHVRLQLFLHIEFLNHRPSSRHHRYHELMRIGEAMMVPTVMAIGASLFPPLHARLPHDAEQQHNSHTDVSQICFSHMRKVGG